MSLSNCSAVDGSHRYGRRYGGIRRLSAMRSPTRTTLTPSSRVAMRLQLSSLAPDDRDQGRLPDPLDELITDRLQRGEVMSRSCVPHSTKWKTNRKNI